MKFFYYSIISLFFVNLSVAQITSIKDGFEGSGEIDSWVGDDCSINTGLDNPFPQGINLSNTVLEYYDTGGQYANIRFETNENLSLSSDYIFSLKIYVPSSGLTGNQNNQVSLKLQDGTIGEPWTTQTEVIMPITLDQWQTVTFDFKNDNFINLDGTSPPPVLRSDFNRVVIQVNGENNNDFVLAYIDDFSYGGSSPDNPVFNNLVWADEFDVDGPVNDDNWFHQTRIPNGNSWFNGEIQHYTDRIENTQVENGILKITARKESFSDQGKTKQYTSARLNSKYAFKYGRVEVRAKLPTGVGTWPAIWMLGKNINENGAYWQTQGFGTTSWPACGEIDIMEHWGDNQNYISSAMHTPSSFGGTVNVGGQFIPTASTEFHIYALEWTSEKMVFSVDDVIHYTYNPPVKNADTWPFNLEQYLLLNIAIQPSIDPSFTSSAMEIDYVRVYQESPLSSLDKETNQKESFYPNPFNDELIIKTQNTVKQSVPVSIYSSDGRLLNAYEVNSINNTLTLDNLDYLAPGMYIIKYKIKNNNYTIKAIKS